MKMLGPVLYKEFLELKSDKGAIRGLVIRSIAFGLLLPTVMYLRHAGVLPGITDIGVIDDAERAVMIKRVLETFGLLFLPSLLSMMGSLLAIPAIAQEVESRTLERLLSLPLSWRNIVFGKLLFYFMVSLISAYITVLVFFSLSRAIVEGFYPPDFVAYVFVLVPAVVFYAVSASFFASARARSMRMANVSGGFLTWALFIGVFFVAQAMGVELGRDLILTVGGLLFAIGLTLAHLTVRVNPEKLLYGRSS